MKMCYADNELQRIIFKSEYIDETKLFYYMSGNGCLIENDSFIIGNNTFVDFGTYFNSFSNEKWRLYTNVSDVSLELELRGKAEIILYHALPFNGKVEETVLLKKEFDSSEYRVETLDIPNMPEKGFIGFSIKTFSEELSFKSAAWTSHTKAQNPDIKLALAFTTYKREEYIIKNVNAITGLANPNIDIFVADNASTLPQDSLGNVHLVRNINAGGAGGFARNMIEIIDNNQGYSHMVIMDDDVVIEPEVFNRLIAFLHFVKPECSNAMLGGAMFRIDKPYLHIESGAKRDQTYIERFGHELDMREKYNVAVTNAFHEEEYNAWWFCVIPMSYIRNDNLPMPIFFQWDDVDFGVRNKAPLILLNGICTWHEAFESKRTAMQLYYVNRNPLIVNACFEGSNYSKVIFKRIKWRLRSDIFLYRYNYVQALIMALKDFSKGPEWLCSLDAEEYNKRLLELNNTVQEFEKIDYEYYKHCSAIDDTNFIYGLVRKLTLNGYLRKPNRQAILPLYADKPVLGYRASEIVFFDEITGKGFIARRDKKAARAVYKEFGRTFKCFKRNYKKVSEQYKAAYPYMHSRKMWDNYLKI